MRPAILFGNFLIINISIAKCLEKTCHEIIEPKLNDTRCGLRPGRSTTDQIFTLQQIFEIPWEYAKDVYTGASGRDGIFAKSPRHNTGAYRGEMAPRARKKFGASCSNLRPFRKCNCIEEKLATLLGPFGATQSSGARGIVRLFPPSLHPWFDTLRPSALLLNSQSPECRTTCQNSEITATL